VVRLDRIGDAVLWLPSAAVLRREKTDVKLELVTTSGAAGIIIKSGLFDVITVIDADRMRDDLVYRWRMLTVIRRRGWSEVAHPIASRCITDGDSVVRLSAAPVRVGVVDDNAITPRWLSRWSDRWYTRLIPTAAPRGGTVHELERNRTFMGQWLGVMQERVLVPVAPPPAQPSLRPAYAVIVPGASWVGKQWPVVRFAELARRLHATWGWEIVVAGSAAERPLAVAISTAATGVPIVDHTGGSAFDLAVEIAGSCLVVTNDTAAIHLAAAAGIPAVAIAGGGYPGRFLPYPPGWGAAPATVSVSMPCFGCNWWCVYHPKKGEPMPCILKVEVEEVWRAIHRTVG